MFHKKGFTLLEILIALFIFSILSIIIMNALHNIINTQSSVDKRAEELAQLQIAMTLLSRDLEQAVNRPIVNSQGTAEPAFVGTEQSITFTHMGLANPLNKKSLSTLQRVRYRFENETLIRDTWVALDQTNKTKLLSRNLIPNVTRLTFQFLDSAIRFNNRWPSANQGQAGDELPYAVQLIISLKGQGKLNQLYVIPQRKIVKPK